MRQRLIFVVLLGVAMADPGGRVVATAQSAQPALRNALAGSSSPYLRSAARQLVHWQEWSDDVFALARKLDRPIYLDIGAIWCHWCHEMDRESYENAGIAALINELFVPVKVDRDVRPDIDARYQRAVTELAGSGGWPLTVFLTPEGHVFYGATYLPPDTLKAVLPQTAQGYRRDRERVTFTAEALRKRVAASNARTATLSVDVVTGTVDNIRRNFDASDGGFSTAPKFPPSSPVALLIHRYVQTADARLLEMVTRTLDRMATGGIRDQLSGRFHRYATDRSWRLPHFEVMLYTQAELLSTYLDAYALTGRDLYRQVAEELIDVLKGSFSGPDGGFYASQDADALPDDDGSYYTWSVAQLEAALPAPEADVLRRYYDVAAKGEMASAPRTKDPTQNVLWVAASPEQIAKDLRRPVDEVTRLIESGRRKMIDARRTRPTPAIDRNILTDWNGLMVSSYLKAYETLGNEEARAFALRTLDFIMKRSFSATAGMYHSLLGSERLVPGLLDDQVMIARALLDAYEVTGDTSHLVRARQIMIWTIEHLWDASGGGFFDSRPNPSAAGLLALPHKPIHDTPASSGNAVAAQVLNRLYYLTQETRFRDFAKVTIETFAGRVRDEGTFTAALGVAAHEYLEYPTTAIVIGKAGDPVAASLHRAALTTFRPGKIVMRVEPDRVSRAQLPAAARPALDSIAPERWPLAFVCSATACALPTASPAEVSTLVKNFGLPR
ncbi:MAG: thioredoxin domain-containing protein [Vicinamibacterales bacterium]